jgi:hypothetical protein
MGEACPLAVPVRPFGQPYGVTCHMQVQRDARRLSGEAVWVPFDAYSEERSAPIGQ